MKKDIVGNKILSNSCKKAVRTKVGFEHRILDNMNRFQMRKHIDDVIEVKIENKDQLTSEETNILKQEEKAAEADSRNFKNHCNYLTKIQVRKMNKLSKN